MKLDDAISDLACIHRHLSNGSVFHGYRALTVALSGAVGLVAAVLQPIVVPQGDSVQFVWYWCITATLLFAVFAIELGLKAWLHGPGLEREKILQAAELLAPSFLVAGLVTLCIASRSDVGPLLPGLWAMFYAIGLLNSLKILPNAIKWCAAYFTICGAISLLTSERYPFAAWQMGLNFGFGQLINAAVLY